MLNVPLFQVPVTTPRPPPAITHKPARNFGKWVRHHLWKGLFPWKNHHFLFIFCHQPHLFSSVIKEKDDGLNKSKSCSRQFLTVNRDDKYELLIFNAHCSDDLPLLIIIIVLLLFSKRGVGECSNREFIGQYNGRE